MSNLKKIASTILSLTSKLVPVDQRLLLFETGLEKADDNPRAVYDYLLKTNEYNFKHKFVVSKETDTTGILPADVVYRNSLKFYWYMMRSKVWVRAQSLGSLVKKKDNQIYLQLWHGSEFKKEGYNIKNLPVEQRVQQGHTKEWDVFVATNERDIEYFRSAVGWYKGEAHALGLPRYDHLLTKEYLSKKAHVFETYKIPTTYQKYILYAPTFRDWELNESVDVISKGLNDVIAVMPKEYALLIRLHPLLLKQSKSLTLPENCFPVTHVNQITDLFLIADTIISDYSSIVYDYMLVNDSIVWYLYDKERYFAERGGVYYDYDTDLPGIVCETAAELKETLASLDSVETRRKMKEKHEKAMKIIHEHTDGEACKRVVALIARKTRVKSQ